MDCLNLALIPFKEIIKNTGNGEKTVFKLPFPEKQVMLANLHNNLYLLPDNKGVKYNLKVLSLPRIQPIIKQALSKFPTHAEVVQYEAFQDKRCSSSSIGWIPNKCVEKMYKKILSERFVEEHHYTASLKTMKEILQLKEPNVDEYWDIIVAVCDSKKYSDLKEGLDAIEYMIKVFDENGCLIDRGSHLEIADDYLMNSYKILFTVDNFSDDKRIDIVYPKDNHIIASKVYKSIYNRETKENDIFIEISDNWEEIVQKIGLTEEE